MATIDLTSGNPVITPAAGQVSLGSMAPTQQVTGSPYDIFISNISGMLSHASNINATNNEALLGQRDALETQAVAGPGGPQTANPAIWSQDQDKIRQGWAAATAPAVTSLTDQMNANTSNLGAINTIAGTFADKLKPTALGPGQSLVTPGGTVVIQGTEYTAVPDVTNPGQYKLMPLNTLSTSGSGSGSGTSTGNPVVDALTKYNGGTDPNYSTKVTSIQSTLDKTYPNPTADTLDAYISGHAKSSPITGQMIMQVAQHSGLSPNLIAAQLALESNFGTVGESPKNNNPAGIKYVGQAGAVQGSEVPQSEGGGYYAKFKSPMDGLFAYADLMAQKTASAQPSTAPTYALPVQAQKYGDDVLAGNRGYTDAVSGMDIYGAVGKPALDAYIRSKNPNFNFAQATALATQQGTIGPAMQYANSAIDKVASAMSGGAIPGQGSNQYGVNTVANWLSGFSTIGGQHTTDLQGYVTEARRAITVALAAKSGGTPSGYEDAAKGILPDNPTPYQVNTAKTVLQGLGGAAQDIYGNPGNAGNKSAVAKGSMSDKDYVEKVLSSQGIKYDDAKSLIPPGHIGAIDNTTGMLLQMLPSDFDPSKYTHL